MKASETDRGVAGVVANLRRMLRKNRRFTRMLQVSRALIHFGPWRHVARAVVRILRPPILGHIEGSLIHGVDPRTAAATLHKDGVVVGATLPPDVLASLRRVTDHLPAREYAHFQLENSDVRALVGDAVVLGVVREYLGCEPELLECTLVVHESENDPAARISPQRRFHFDFAGWHSLNVFVYLTDVNESSGAHEVVVGTHRHKELRDAVRSWIPDEEIHRRFGTRVRTITGAAGTLFFEDTEAFHRRQAMKRRRVMLNILYASHRGFLSRGRLAPSYRDYLVHTHDNATPASRHRVAAG